MGNVHVEYGDCYHDVPRSLLNMFFFIPTKKKKKEFNSVNILLFYDDPQDIISMYLEFAF